MKCGMSVLQVNYFISSLHIVGSLVPRPRPAFRRLQYGLIMTESWVGPGNEAILWYVLEFCEPINNFQWCSANLWNHLDFVLEIVE